eukprot:1178057-Prorocentrum_minimum.AAC.3
MASFLVCSRPSSCGGFNVIPGRGRPSSTAVASRVPDGAISDREVEAKRTHLRSKSTADCESSTDASHVLPEFARVARVLCGFGSRLVGAGRANQHPQRQQSSRDRKALETTKETPQKIPLLSSPRRRGKGGQ